MPGRGPRRRPPLIARSAARAARRAWSPRVRTKLSRRLSCAAIRARQSSTRAAEERRPAAMARLAAAAVRGAANSALMVGTEDEAELVGIAETTRDAGDQLPHPRLPPGAPAPRRLPR